MSVRPIVAVFTVLLLLCGMVGGACMPCCGVDAGLVCGHAAGGEARAMSATSCHGMSGMQEQTDAVTCAATVCPQATLQAAVMGEGAALSFGVTPLAVLAGVAPASGELRVAAFSPDWPPRSIAGSPRNLISIRV